MASLSPTPQLVGRVRRAWRYPVKSMAAEPLEHAELSWHGLAGDRRWAFVRSGSEANGFPWHTIRENPRMGLYRARLRDPDRPDASPVDVRTPDADTREVTDPALAAELGTDLRVMRLKRGLHDSMPVSLITTTTVAELCDRSGVAADPLRFRPNLLVEPTVDRPFLEDDWVGATLGVGGSVLRINRRDPRCVIVNVDPSTGAVNPEVLKQVGSERGACAGVYASVVRPGPVRVGDEVVLERTVDR